MAEDFSDLKSLAEMAVEYLDLLVDTTKELAAAQKETNEEIKKNTAATKESTTQKKKEADETKKASEAIKDLKEKSKALGKELLDIANAGVKFGTAIGVSATKGVQLEIQNRLAVAAQLKNFSADLAVTIEQLKGAQEGFTDVFIGAAQGMQISAKGSIGLVSDLKKGFKSEFEPTAETFRILTQMGMSTTEQFDAFRKATGRASLSNNQLATLYNKNTLSFLLYGNSFGKAAVQAERLGINLASVQAAQEGLVTNLDGTIDTVAQLNQLGANIDFGTLVRVAETEGPDALMKLVRASVPESLMQSASTRALFKQLGISVEDYIKSGGEQQSAADKLEKRMTEAASKTGSATESISSLGAMASKISSILGGSFGGLALAAVYAAAALIKVGNSGGITSLLNLLKNPTAGMGMAGKAGMVGAGLGLGIGGAMLGRSLVEQGNTKTGIGLGALGGGIGLALALAPFTGGLSLAALGVGALAGGGYAAMGMNKANDMFSAGYGSRVLFTPKGAYALNNADDIAAGTNLFPKGTLQAGGGTDPQLISKLESLIDALQNANTTINVGGVSQTVPRMELVGVYSRNER